MIALYLVLAATSVNAYWRMSCGIIQTGRVDPIVAPGGISGHAHKVSGASNFGTSSTYNSLLSSRCTSCEIQDDLSAYWTPQLYYQHANGSFEAVPNGGTVVYYLGRGDNRSAIEPFPPGFKMVSGENSARSVNAARTYSTGRDAGRPLSDRVSFACLDSSGGIPETSNMARTDCDNGMRAQVHFQSCWDGGEYKADQSHVAYLSQIDNGVCPPSHPRPLPHLFFEVIYGVNNVAKTAGGRFVFANGDTTGYGFHGDFMNGWKPDVLKEAVGDCLSNDNGGSVTACAALAKSHSPYASTNCPERPPIVDEKVRGLLDQLPGCNPVTSGPARAPQQICPVQPGAADSDDSATNSTMNPAVGDRIGDWAYAGCAKEGSKRVLDKYATASNSMTVQVCTAACKDKGYSLAGVENSRECYCAHGLNGGSYMSTAECEAAPKMVCAGNQSQWCGAPGLLTVWRDTAYRAPQPLVVGATKIADGVATYHGCWSEATNGRALSSDRTAGASMTNELCAAYCRKGGYAFAGTEYSQECYCGNTIGGTNITDIAQCSLPCAGDKASLCGSGGKLSVWALQAKAPEKVTALDGRAVYMGCFTDEGAGGRTLSKDSYASSSMTLETCAAYCQKGGYRLFGMEYGRECYCGNDTKSQATLVADGDCSMADAKDYGQELYYYLEEDDDVDCSKDDCYPCKVDVGCRINKSL